MAGHFQQSNEPLPAHDPLQATQKTELQLTEVVEHDHNSLLHHPKDGEATVSASRLRHPRKVLSFSTIAQGLADLTLAIGSIYFIAYALLVYLHQGQLADRPSNSALLEAAKYNPTLFPILFAAIVTKFLRALAALKLESGISVLTMDYLLSSQTVFSAIIAPLNLKAINLAAFLLILLWALSPIGGQAGLRLISTAPLYQNATNNFTYLAFVSPFTNEGVGSASAEVLSPINAMFTAALASSPNSKASPQDQFGNIKIPIYEYLEPNSPNEESRWRNVPNNDTVLWSSLTGLPVHGIPAVGTSRFVINTGYMLTACNVTGKTTNETWMGSLESSMYWSGANFAIDFDETHDSFRFQSLDNEGNPPPKPLTVAMCQVSMSYVMVQVQCEGANCNSLAVQPSTDPASHNKSLVSPWSSLGPDFTPLAGLGQEDVMFTNFFSNFVNSTNPAAACDTSFCSTSAIEGYLADPGSPFSFTGSNPSLWTFGDQLISQRFAQLLNTYWIDSIAPIAIAGNFSTGDTSTADTSVGDSSGSTTYHADNAIGTIETQVIVIRCNHGWFAILLLASILILILGFAAVVLNILRRGPDILNGFTSLLRDNPYCSAIMQNESSMENSSDQSKRLRDVKVQLGDVKPDEDVGYVALATLDNSSSIRRLNPRRLYA